MVERADITRAKSQAFREGVETAMRARTNGFERMVERIVDVIRTSANERWVRHLSNETEWLGRVSVLNMVLAGWLLVGLGLALNAVEFFTAGRAPLSFSGLVAGGIAIAAVYFGMHCAVNSASRTICFVINVLATVASLACWLALNKHLWGL